jgi:hypothetical protein
LWRTIPCPAPTAVDMFIELGLTVFDAYNGYHALALLEGHPESLLFVDVRRLDTPPSHRRRPKKRPSHLDQRISSQL